MIESVVTRWHYLVDLPAGAALAVLIVLLTNRFYRSRRTAEVRAAVPVGQDVTVGLRIR